MNALATIALISWAVSLVNILLNLILLGRLRKAPLTRFPFVSIIVPARDEERAIERSVRALLSQDYSRFEVIVVDDRSTDRTGAILDSLARENERLVVIHGEEPPCEWLGKPWALHQGSLKARGELLLFVDADVYYAPATLATAVRQNEATGDAMTFLLPHFEMRGVWEHAIMPAVPMTPFSWPMWLGEFFSIPLLGVGGGTGNLIRRTAYDAVNGHAALRDAVVDDVGLAHHVRRGGWHTGLARTERLVSVRMYHGFSEIVRGFTKNAFTVMGGFPGVLFLLIMLVVAHVLPYPLAIAGNPIAIAALALILISRIVFFAFLGYPMWNAILLHPLMTIGWIWITIRSTWVVGIRRELPWRGRTYDPARTRFGAGR